MDNLAFRTLSWKVEVRFESPPDAEAIESRVLTSWASAPILRPENLHPEPEVKMWLQLRLTASGQAGVQMLMTQSGAKLRGYSQEATSQGWELRGRSESRATNQNGQESHRLEKMRGQKLDTSIGSRGMTRCWDQGGLQYHQETSVSFSALVVVRLCLERGWFPATAVANVLLLEDLLIPQLEC